jgi:hypothetical protein
MPIRINLLAEAQAAEEMRRKDPVKRAAWIGGFVVFVVLLCAATLQFKIIASRSENNSLQMSWKTIEKRVKEINDHRASTREVEQKLSALDQFTTNRMLWAPVLNALQYTPVDGIQVVRVRGDQTYTLNEGTKPRTDESGISLRGTPATVTEHIVIKIEGRDHSSRPGDQVPKFKQSLISYPFFESQLQKTNKIQLTSQSAPQSEGLRSFVSFGLQMHFEDKERRLYE